MEPMHYWFIAGIILLGLEILTLELSLASFGIGSMAGGIAAWLNHDFFTQSIAFAVISLTMFFGFRPLFRQYLDKSTSNRAHGTNALIGKTALVTETIQNLKDSGRVRIEGESWKARSIDETTIEKNQTVKVEKIEGVTAYVKPTT